MNCGICCLYTILLVMTLLVLIVTITGWQAWNDALNDIEYQNLDTRCFLDPQTAVDLSGVPCCLTNEGQTASKYLEEYDMVVNPSEKYYLTVCEEYCLDGMASDGVCENGTGQEGYDTCVEISQPVKCEGLSNPVAFDGVVLYYPHAAYQDTCKDTWDC